MLNAVHATLWIVVQYYTQSDSKMDFLKTSLFVFLVTVSYLVNVSYCMSNLFAFFVLVINDQFQWIYYIFSE